MTTKRELMWKQISFVKFVMLQQGMTIAATGILEKSGYWIEWSKPDKFGLASTKRALRLEERPHESAHIDGMSMYFERKGQ